MEIHQTKKLNKATFTTYHLRATSKPTTLMAQTYSCSNLGFCYGVYKFMGLHIVFELLFLIVMSPLYRLNSCLAVKNLKVYDKLTSMLGDYGTNEHIQGFRYQYSFSIYCQV